MFHSFAGKGSYLCWQTAYLLGGVLSFTGNVYLYSALFHVPLFQCFGASCWGFRLVVLLEILGSSDVVRSYFLPPRINHLQVLFDASEQSNDEVSTFPGRTMHCRGTVLMFLYFFYAQSNPAVDPEFGNRQLWLRPADVRRRVITEPAGWLVKISTAMGGIWGPEGALLMAFLLAHANVCLAG